MIKTPADAVPHDDCDAFMDSVRARETTAKWFTASETAQIARQFAASLMCAPECQTDEFERWQHLFDEWQK